MRIEPGPKRWLTLAALALAVFTLTYGVFDTVSQNNEPLARGDVSSLSNEPSGSTNCQGVKVQDGDDLASIADAAPSNTTFCISGFHRLTGEIVPKDGQRFIGVGWPVLNGSGLLTSFDQANGLFLVTGQTQDYQQVSSTIEGERCMEGYEGCRFPEDVYLDDRFLQKVLSMDELEPGKYFFDYSADTIYLADDPSGHKVEASVVRRAFANYDGANDVVIRGLVVEKFSAYSGEDGAIAAFKADNWVVERNEVRLNHGSGIMASDTHGMVIRGNQIHTNGCGGITGAAPATLLIEGNEIAFNNALFYQSFDWSCGGGKLVRADGVIFKDNRLHDNNGFGFWTDGMNINVLYEGNTFEDNAMGGILHEINDGAGGQTVIRDNQFGGNGFGHPNRIMFGAAIMINASNHVKIVGNLLGVNAHGITLDYTPRDAFPGSDLTVHDILVSDNEIHLPSGQDPHSDVGRVGFYTGIVGAPPPSKVTFADNHYFLGDLANGPHFSLPDPALMNTLSTAAEWQAAGFDTSSQFSRDNVP